jgi:carboxyl-terminal processing protease
MESAKENRNTNFRSSTRDVEKILQDFRAQNVEGVVLDLSKNGGGSLTEAITLTGLFINQGPVVQVKNANGVVEQYQDEEPGTSWDGPLVVLTSKFSASASEIFAGAIKDYHRGIVVGDPATHGKGTVQSLMDLGQQLFHHNRENLGALKVTLQQFYLPDGESTQREGVTADVILPSITSKMDVSEGDLKYALENDRVNSTRHDIYSMTPSDLVSRLRKNSAVRIEKDSEFVDMLRRIELYVRQKEQNTISLVEEEFIKRRREMDAEKEDEKKAMESQMNTEIVYHDTFYNREVLNIAFEYVEGLKQQNLAKAN